MKYISSISISSRRSFGPRVGMERKVANQDKLELCRPRDVGCVWRRKGEVNNPEKLRKHLQVKQDRVEYRF